MTLSHLSPRDAEIEHIVAVADSHLHQAQAHVTRAHRLEIEAAALGDTPHGRAKLAVAREYRDAAMGLSHEALLMQLQGSVK